MSFLIAYLAVSLFFAIYEGVGASSGFDRALQIVESDPGVQSLTEGYKRLGRVAMIVAVFVLAFVLWPAWLIVKIYGRVRD